MRMICKNMTTAKTPVLDISSFYTQEEESVEATNVLTRLRLEEVGRRLSTEEYMDRVDSFLAKVPGRVVYDFRRWT